jgi:hypothetical protein
VRTEPSLNFWHLVSDEPVWTRYRAWMVSDQRNGSVKETKQILGKQTRVETYLHRYWVWETDLWCLFVSTRGMTLELTVPDDYPQTPITKEHVVAGLTNFLDTWCVKGNLNSSLPNLI